MPYNIESYVMFLMPVVLFGLLFAVPFISLGGQRAPLRRPWAIVGVLMTLITIISLTFLGKEAPWSPHFDTEPIAADVLNVSSPEATQGYELFFDKGCQYCHRIEGEGGLRGPDLTYVGGRLSADDMDHSHCERGLQHACLRRVTDE